MEIHLLAKKHTIGKWATGLLMGPNLHPKRARAWRDDPTQREHVHGEMIPAKESMCMESWSHPGEPERVHASPNHAREEIFPNQIP